MHYQSIREFYQHIESLSTRRLNQMLTTIQEELNSRYEYTDCNPDYANYLGFCDSIRLEVTMCFQTRPIIFYRFGGRTAMREGKGGASVL